jgi:hypothetical protein
MGQNYGRMVWSSIIFFGYRIFEFKEKPPSIGTRCDDCSDVCTVSRDQRHRNGSPTQRFGACGRCNADFRRRASEEVSSLGSKCQPRVQPRSRCRGSMAPGGHAVSRHWGSARRTTGRPVHLDFGGSRTTMRNVAIGPRKRDTIHQFKPLLPFVCARPAFMRERVDQPTAYSPVSRIIIKLLEASGRQPESLAVRDAYSKMPVLITPGTRQKGKLRRGQLGCSSQAPNSCTRETPRHSP